MLKNKVIFPEDQAYQSPYQLEDCQRRLQTLKRELQPIVFQRIDNNTMTFRIRRIKSQHVPYPMIAFEIIGTLQRWGGTGTRLKPYRLKRFSARIDTWVITFLIVSLMVAIGLMIPAVLHHHASFQQIAFLIILGLSMIALPVINWIRHIRALDIDREIDALHQAIMQQLDIQELNT